MFRNGFSMRQGVRAVCVLLAVQLAVLARAQGSLPDDTPLEHLQRWTSSGSGDASAKLRGVSVVTRHGDRTPVHVFPAPVAPAVWTCTSNDEWAYDRAHSHRVYRKQYLPGRNVLAGNCSQGHLTEQGRRQHLDMGAKMRQRYINELGLLPAQLDPQLVSVRSTDVPRTLHSAQSHMLGLYPVQTRRRRRSSNSSNRGSTLDAPAPLPVLTIESPRDNLFFNTDLCPALKAAEARVVASDEWQAKEKAMQPLKQRFADALGLPLDQLPGWTAIADNIVCRLWHNKPLPGQVTKDMVDELAEFCNWMMSTMFRDHTLRRLGMGNFLAEMLDQLEATWSGASPHRYLMYSGHDTTVGPLLHTLGVFDGIWPSYAAHLVTEMWDVQGEPHLRLYYSRDGAANVPVTVPGCPDHSCPLSQFRAVLADVIPSDYPAECSVGASF